MSILSQAETREGESVSEAIVERGEPVPLQENSLFWGLQELLRR